MLVVFPLWLLFRYPRSLTCCAWVPLLSRMTCHAGVRRGWWLPNSPSLSFSLSLFLCLWSEGRHCLSSSNWSGLTSPQTGEVREGWTAGSKREGGGDGGGGGGHGGVAWVLSERRLKKLQSQMNSNTGQPQFFYYYLMLIGISMRHNFEDLFVCLFLSSAMPINNQCIKWRANGINSSSFAQMSAENEAWSSRSLCLELLIRSPLQGISAWC